MASCEDCCSKINMYPQAGKQRYKVSCRQFGNVIEVRDEDCVGYCEKKEEHKYA